MYSISSDTKVVSKILEIHLFPHFLAFAKRCGFRVELATHQNWCPDLTFTSRSDSKIKFAVDLKTTYRNEKNPDFCNGFTLGAHGTYFTDRQSSKNVRYPYGDYYGHFCLGIIYSRSELDKSDELKIYKVDEVETIPPVISRFVFFAEEKWKIASDQSGSGNTANIGSITIIDDILNGNGVFAKADEALFDDYWINFGKIETVTKEGVKKIRNFADYLNYRGLSSELNNPRARRGRNDR